MAASTLSDAIDHDSDGFHETITISPDSAGRMIAGDALGFYTSVRAKISDWRLLPPLADSASVRAQCTEPASPASRTDASSQDTAVSSGTQDVVPRACARRPNFPSPLQLLPRLQMSTVQASSFRSAGLSTASSHAN